MRYEPQHAVPARLVVAMTPMIDVVFLLLIFFLCTATFQQPEEDLAASLLVPTEGVGSAIAPPPELEEVLVVGTRVATKTRWIVNEGDKPYDAPQLVELLRTLVSVDRNLPVTVDPGANVPLGDVVAVYDAARRAGFSQVRLVATAQRSQPAQQSQRTEQSQP